jgi:site-specific recombinase XerC
VGHCGVPAPAHVGLGGAAVTTAKIDDFHVHDLRHTFASHFIMATGDLVALQKILGHKTLAMTMRYAHLAQAHVRKAIEAVSFSTKSAHSAKIEPERAVSPR